MARWWILPVSAGALGVGILLQGHDPEAGPSAAALTGGLLLVAGAAAAGTPRQGSRDLLVVAGLLGPDRPPSARQRVLAAAGLPVHQVAIPRPPWSPIRVIALVLGMGLAGTGWAGVRGVLAPSLGDLAGRGVSFEGVAAGDLRPEEYSWSLEARLVRIRPSGQVDRRTSLRVWISVAARPPPVSAGMPISGSGTLEPLPGGSGFGEYLRGRGVAGILEASRLRVLGPPASPAFRLADAVREGFQHGALAALPRREAGLLLGLAIGDTRFMDPEVAEDFRATGLGHLLAVSGSNVALFLAPILGLVVALRLRRSIRLVVALAAVGFFVVLTRWEPSVLRAGVMAGLALVGVWSGRPRHTGALLGGAVLVLLVWDPGLAGSVGFQLSVAATGGIAALASPLAVRLRWMPRPLALAAAATVAAQIAVTPLLLLHFGVVPTATVVANLLAFPAVAVALFAGIAASAAALVSPAVGHVLGRAAALPLGYLTEVADRTARLALPALTSSGWVAPVAIAVLAAVLAWRVRRRRTPVGVVAATVVVAVVAWSAAPTAGPPAGLEIIFLDVGQGDAAVVRTPDGANVLIDAGPDPDEVARDLAGLGIRRLDLVIASHAHADHVEGFPAVFARHPVGLVLEPGCPGDSPSYDRFLRSIADERLRVRHPRGGTAFQVGRLQVSVLGPDACYVDSPNDDSLVIRIAYGDDVVLFPGDAEIPAQEDLLEDGDPVAADVLKVPHHGGDTSLPAFFAATEARIAVVSTGPNEYGHPVPSVLTTLRLLGMRVVRTDLRGDITVRFEDDGLLLESTEG